MIHKTQDLKINKIRHQMFRMSQVNQAEQYCPCIAHML